MYFLFIKQATNEQRRATIPKEAPWKTLVLNKQFPLGGCEFSTVTSGTERKRGFFVIVARRSEPLVKMFPNLLLSLFLISNLYNKHSSNICLFYDKLRDSFS